MKLAIIFNTCGISGHENVNRYVHSIHSILSQKFDDFRVIVSSCLNSDRTKNLLNSEFKDAISYSFIDERLPVNITFNKSIQNSVEAFGESEAYLYVDSGIDISSDLETLAKLYELHKKEHSGMTASRVDCDAGYWLWFGGSVPGWSAHHNPTPSQDLECARIMFSKGNFEVPIGKTVNLHLQLFDNEIYKNFDKRLMPDIFASHSTEGLFTFMTSCLNKKFLVHKDVTANHFTSMDGGSSGFRPEPAGVPGYQHTINFTKRKIMDAVNTQEARDCGFGYEECQSILMHDHSKFDENGFSKDPQRLKNFLLNNFYLTKSELDYAKINSVFIK